MHFKKNKTEIPDIKHPDDYYPIDGIFYKLAGIIFKNKDEAIARVYVDEASDTCIVAIYDNESPTLDNVYDLLIFAEEQTGKEATWQVWESSKYEKPHRIAKSSDVK